MTRWPDDPIARSPQFPSDFSIRGELSTLEDWAMVGATCCQAFHDDHQGETHVARTLLPIVGAIVESPQARSHYWRGHVAILRPTQFSKPRS